MCTVILGLGVAADAPLVIASNRDELRTRESDPPAALSAAPPLFGGRDRLAGGTWLAVDPRGRFCAVTNRYLPGRPVSRDPARRSRGEIAVNALSLTGDQSAIDFLTALDPGDYNPVNVVYASQRRAFWISLDEDGVHGSELHPGMHVITVAGADQSSDAKCSWLLERASALPDRHTHSDSLLEAMTALLHSHEPAAATPHSAACIHEPVYGTVSGSTVVVTETSVNYRHAEGFPCITPYEPVSLSA
jgi:uncharacterized protein with NRDE domain